MVLAQPAPESCTPDNEDDIAGDDPLINHMFEAYKVCWSLENDVQLGGRGKRNKKCNRTLLGL